MKPLPRSAVILIGITVLLALPFVALGVREAADGRVRPEVAALIFALAVLLSFRPIRVQPNTELAAADVAVLAGIVLMPAGAIACVAGLARLTNDVLTRKRTPQIVRNAASVAVATGAAACAYNLLLWPAAGFVEPAAATIIASATAAIVLVTLDIAQIVVLQRLLGNITFDGGARKWIERTVRAQLLWGLAAVIAVQVVLIEPWFLVPGIPLFVFGYLDIRARFVAERRARLLATLVEVGHAVGMSLDTTEVFRAVYAQVHTVLEADAFFVAIVDRARSLVSYRFLVDGNEELPPADRPLAGTLVGLVVERGEPVLIGNSDRDIPNLGLVRSAWGTVHERSILVAPMRIQGVVVGALSVQSVKANAYDEGDL